MKSMKTFFKMLSIACALSCICGCTSITYTEAGASPEIKGGNGAYKQVLISNYGYYLFNCLPLGCGGLSDGSFELFSDNVNLDKAMKILKDECANEKSKSFSNVQVSQTSTCIFGWVPYIGTTLGIYWFKEIQISAAIYSENFKTERDAK